MKKIFIACLFAAISISAVADEASYLDEWSDYEDGSPQIAEEDREEAWQERARKEKERQQATLERLLMQEKDVRVEAIKSVEANHKRREAIYVKAAGQRTQLNTTTMVEQNRIIINQNERIIELLKRMTEGES